ncbi:MFS transporter [Campylobacter sp. MIT 21-1685]|uniref:MFS transporter n=1 Tax=unclassified Campylobacter TaxID=2593542 RepID=UPI00224AB33C|nr:MULTISPECIES: MFS transporter [unclassified Campylobacter]MCX2683163.1 MFS transporter [Campylobacter sp. MIT 21-1684]MCX2751378.1 MFS transporter [Campylobacter sp. MIT 21-1682]MCX2807577.1 MFS transporter [Campylobacter sp. MIT 21-1685]
MSAIQKKIFWINFFIVFFLALNLRAPITAIGPMIENIQNAYNLNSTFAGLLTTLPLIAFGSISFFVGFFNATKALLFAILLIIAGEVLRSYSGIVGLFFGMLILGCGIAIANVLLPSFIKHSFPKKTAFMMGIYSLCLNISSVLGIALALPLLEILALNEAMIFWILFALAALFVYLPQIKNGRIKRHQKNKKTASFLITQATTWKITLFIGLQSFIAYALFSWYVQFIVEKGFTKESAAHIVLVSQLCAVPVSLLAPLLLDTIRKELHTFYIGALCVMYIIGFYILYTCNSYTMLLLGALVLGCPWGGVFGIALLFIAQKSANVKIAAKLSAFSQGFGYLIAALAPLLIGFLHDTYKNFKSILLLLLVVAILVNIFAYLAYKSTTIE